ncbi:MAG: SRPBCC family protein [Solirubrobacterales bacterium]
MAELPANIAVASGFVSSPSEDVWAFVSDVANWPRLFPNWIAEVVADDDRFTATGPAKEKADLYPVADAETLALEVEVVDELGSADTLRMRVVDVPGGSIVFVVHGRLSGTADAAWQSKRDAVESGLLALSVS